MKFSVDAKVLREIISSVAAIAPQRSTLEVLRNLMMETTPNSLIVFGTDTKVSIKRTARGDGVNVEEVGKVLVDAQKAAAVVGEFSSGMVDVVADNHGTTFSQAKKRFKVLGEATDLYPSIAFLGDQEKALVSIPGKDLHTHLAKTAFAASKDDGRYAMCGVLFDFLGDTLRFVGLDSRRMAINEVKIPKVQDERLSALVPTKGISVLLKDIDEDGVVGINLGEQFVHFRMTDLEIAATLVNGKFPPYEKAIPDVKGDGVLIDRVAFIEALSGVSVMCSRETMGAQFRFEGDSLKIASLSQQGQADVEISTIGFTGDPIEFEMHSLLLLEGLRAIDNTTSVSVHIGKGLGTPLVLKDKSGMKYVIAPMGKTKKTEEETPVKDKRKPVAVGDKAASDDH